MLVAEANACGSGASCILERWFSSNMFLWISVPYALLSEC